MFRRHGRLGANFFNVLGSLMNGLINCVTARVNEHIKEMLIAAADLTGATLNQFLVQAALVKAETFIEKDRLIRLSIKDAECFFDMLENPPEPNAKHPKAKAYYQQFGFMALPEQLDNLFMPVSTIAKSFGTTNVRE